MTNKPQTYTEVNSRYTQDQEQNVNLNVSLMKVIRPHPLMMLHTESDNNTVKTISMMGVNGLYFVLGANYRVLSTKCGMNLNII